MPSSAACMQRPESFNGHRLYEAPKVCIVWSVISRGPHVCDRIAYFGIALPYNSSVLRVRTLMRRMAVFDDVCCQSDKSFRNGLRSGGVRMHTYRWNWAAIISCVCQVEELCCASACGRLSPFRHRTRAPPSLYFFGHFIFECRRQPCRSTAEEDKNNPPRREKWTLMTG